VGLSESDHALSRWKKGIPTRNERYASVAHLDQPLGRLSDAASVIDHDRIGPVWPLTVDEHDRDVETPQQTLKFRVRF
jgi:hypothetical protein